ncbi:hypothetical protein [Rubrobacter indicoceani]|uniref:hypothetical protein n=1 Tax=Rubrobacter indicoceani TaxID=2051957 RepID=UPI000E5AE38F|nr:hypothetical protein [Rubrobacter indicoceani]
MNFGRVMLVGLIYGLGFMLIKGLFPEPFVLLLFQNAESSEGNLTLLSLVYMGSGVVAGLISAPIFAVFLAYRRRSREASTNPAEDGSSGGNSYGMRFVLSVGLGALMGVVSGVLILISYSIGLLPTGGVLDPIGLIGSSNFAPGTPLLVAWTIMRDVLPAVLAGLFLAPIGGDMLQRMYAPPTPLRKEYNWDG